MIKVKLLLNPNVAFVNKNFLCVLKVYSFSQGQTSGLFWRDLLFIDQTWQEDTSIPPHCRPLLNNWCLNYSKQKEGESLGYS